MAVLPSSDIATEKPWTALPTAPVPTSLLPCWFQTPPLRVKTHVAPACELSLGPPTTAVLPSSDSATDQPCAAPTPPVPTSLLPCWVQTPLLRVKTHAAPACELSPGPPTMAVLPSADSATEMPCWAPPTAPVPTSLLPCWLQTPLALRLKTHAAPACELSPGPPTMAVLPSAESATEMPCWALPTAPVPTSLLPCWLQTPLALRMKSQAAPAPELLPALALSSGPPTMAVLPSADSATDMPCW